MNQLISMIVSIVALTLMGVSAAFLMLLSIIKDKEERVERQQYDKTKE